jgi:hypothetical protein
LAGYGGIKEYIVVIAAVIYVLAMFPLFYFYQIAPADRYTILPDLTWVSTAGCILLFAQWFVAALTAPSKPVQKPTS